MKTLLKSAPRVRVALCMAMLLALLPLGSLWNVSQARPERRTFKTYRRTYVRRTYRYSKPVYVRPGYVRPGYGRPLPRRHVLRPYRETYYRNGHRYYRTVWR